MNAMRRCKFLAVDDYGTGGIWFVLLADSEEQIHKALPTVQVFPPGERPAWMSEAMLNEIEDRDTYDIEDLPPSAWMNRLRQGRP